ncbi:MAG: hypothetical protein AAGA91_04785 [Pseudomonadota bacterium]
MFKKTAVLAGLGLAVSGAAQADYRWQADGAITGGDFSSIALGGAFFFEEVDTDKGPFAEAAFLDRASFVALAYQDGEINNDGVLDDLETKRWGFDGRYVTDGGGWILDLGYAREEPDNPLIGGPSSFEIDVFNVGVGKYIFENTSIVLSYQNSDVDEGGDLDSYRADLDHFWKTGSGGLKLELGYGWVDVGDGDDIDIYAIDATYYFGEHLGIGGFYSVTGQNNDELEQYGAQLSYFITDKVGVNLRYSEGELEDTDVETDSYLIGVTVRF